MKCRKNLNKMWAAYYDWNQARDAPNLKESLNALYSKFGVLIDDAGREAMRDMAYCHCAKGEMEIEDESREYKRKYWDGQELIDKFLSGGIPTIKEFCEELVALGLGQYLYDIEKHLPIHLRVHYNLFNFEKTCLQTYRFCLTPEELEFIWEKVPEELKYYLIGWLPCYEHYILEEEKGQNKGQYIRKYRCCRKDLERFCD